MARKTTWYVCQECGAVYATGAKLTSEMDDTGKSYVDQLINGRAVGPIKMAIRA